MMSSTKKPDKKSPYGDHSIEDVMAAELGHYYIQVGGDIFTTESGKMAFDKERADYFYSQIVDGLNDMRKNGNREEQEDAFKCLLLLKIYPLRIH